MIQFAIVNMNSQECVGYRAGVTAEHAVNNFVQAFPKFAYEKPWLSAYPEWEWHETQMALTRQRLAEYDEYCDEQDRLIRYI